MKLFTAHWEENGKAGRRSFLYKKDTIAFGQEKVRATDCSSVSIWSYENDANLIHLLVAAHDRVDWWNKRTYVGTVLKSGNYTAR